MKRQRKEEINPVAAIPSDDEEEYELAEIIDNSDEEDDIPTDDDIEEEVGVIDSEEEDDDDENEGTEKSSSKGEDNKDDEEEFSSDSSPEEDDEDEWPSSSDNEVDDHLPNGQLKVLRPKHPLPEIDPVYDPESSDEETTNTVGNVPKEWYEEFPHVGYTVDGKKIMKNEKGDELERFLSLVDDPDAWRSVYDNIEDKDIVLTKEELEMLKNIQKGQFPSSDSNPYEPTVEWFTSKTEVTSLSAAPEPKRRFVPSKWEAQRIMHIVRAIRQGRIVPGKKQEDKRKNKFYGIWDDVADEPTERGIMHIPAPKAALPTNEESYNPPEEYIPTEQELAEYLSLDPQDRPRNFIPKKYSALRSVPAYARFIQERFDRCLDLYLCPRTIKKKLNIDPESLIPKLPNPKDLQPFPTQLAITYRGHTGRVRSISVDPTGQFLASGSDDCTVRIWEVVTGRCIKIWTMEDPITNISFNPNKTLALLAVTAGPSIHILSPPPTLTSPDQNLTTTGLLSRIPPTTTWTRNSNDALLTIKTEKTITDFTWHRKGDYFATVSPDAGSKSVLIHQLSKGASQNPFRKLKGLVQKVLFHNSKPFFFVATQRTIRLYNLSTQSLTKTLLPSTKWISSLSLHPGGDNLLVSTYDKRVSWFDLDLSTKPYKTLRYHTAAVRDVKYSSRCPLFASCGDDGWINVFWGMVWGDLERNAGIVPVKRVWGGQKDGLGVLAVEWHPVQPWVFGGGADGDIKLFS